MKKFHVIVDGCAELAELIVGMAVEHGWDGLSKHTLGQEYLYGIFFDLSCMNITWDRKEYAVAHTTSDLKTVSEAIALIKKGAAKTHKVKLNDTYTATYFEGEDVVEVGCQKFSKDTLKKLNEAVFGTPDFHVQYKTEDETVTLLSKEGNIYPIKYNHEVYHGVMKGIAKTVSDFLGCELVVVD